MSKEIDSKMEMVDSVESDSVENKINMLGVQEASEFGSVRTNKISIDKLKEIRTAIQETTTKIIQIPNGQEKEFFTSCGIDSETKKTSLVNRINSAHKVDGLGLIAKLDAGNIKIKAF